MLSGVRLQIENLEITYIYICLYRGQCAIWTSRIPLCEGWEYVNAVATPKSVRLCTLLGFLNGRISYNTHVRARKKKFGAIV